MRFSGIFHLFNLFQIRDHPSLVCFANPYNLSNLYEMFKIYEMPLSLCLLLRRDADIAFVDSEDLKAIFFILMVRLFMLVR